MADPAEPQTPLPEALGERARALVTAWREAAGGVELPADVERELPRVFAWSEFIATSCTRDPALLPSLAADGLARARGPGEMVAACSALVAACADEAGFMAALRRLRRRELVRIAWRDLAGRASLPETLAELTAFADAAVQGALAFAVRSLEPRYGTPRSESGEAQELVVLGMGKLGGGELNFSSDIDLIFLFPEGGETDGRRPVANEEYFTRLGQTLIRLLDAPTVDGFVFRVDMRLRPFGDSGPLVASFGAFEDYLQQHGRDWERYAYVKARALTGVERYASVYDDAVRPFVYRRYLDFGVFESLREMKDLISREVARREMQDNVKLGPGGIREVEFVVQAQQLIRGGSDRRLQTQSLQAVLPRLEGSKLLSSEAVVALQAGYEFLRRTENRLQMFDDGQAHSLPADEPGRLRLATSMGHATWESFRAALDAHRERVAHHFQEVVFGPRAPMSSRSEAGTTELDALWQLQPDPARVREEVARAGVAEPAPVADALLALRDAPYFRRLDEFGKKRLATLLPRVLAELAGPGEAGALRVPPEAQVGTCQRVLRIIEAIGSRTSYLALLIENHAALSRLVEICRHGDFLADQVARFPLLLDELIDARIFQSLPDRAQFSHELDIRCEHVADDPERQVEALRQFQRAAMFRVATLDLTGRLPLMKVSDRLTDIAELILERAMRMAWDQITAVHGVPLCGAGEALREAGVAAVGYGKLGGMELGYGSDLDLVFLHDSAGEVQQTSGPKVVDNAVFFVRLGQRIVHLLTMHSNAGRLYEVDMRLRPSGKGGLIITNIEAFADYQRSEAWTWEHQALLHSRSVAGSPPIRAGFERIRLDTLANHVRRETLREEVRKMRERMRNELSRSKAGQFDMKQDPGGIADIEFLSQFWALYWAKDYPPVVTFSDTIRQLESVGSAALIDHRVIDLLRDTYRRYRQHAHHLSLEKGEPVVDGAPWEETRRAVADVWQRTMVAGNDPRPV